MKTELIVPVSENERISSLDLLRGFAVLGILIMNIQSFSMINSAYINPDSFGDLTGINKWGWMLSHTFADLKFMGLFTLLFGAGIVLFSEKAREKGVKSGPLHYRRTLWLLFFGLIHAYLLWRGDILVSYALCALIIYLYHRMKPKTLLILGLISIFIGFLIPFLSGMSIPYWPPEAIENSMLSWRPTQEAIQSELAAYQGNWINSLKFRAISSIFMQTFLFLYEFAWRTGGIMLLGMALFKWGVFSAEKSKRFYFLMMLLGFVIGLPLIIYGMIKNFNAGWSLEYSMFHGAMFNYWGSILVSLAYVAITMLWEKNGRDCLPKKLLKNVGRMAFSNYFLQTIICVFIFHSFGLKLYGMLDRWQQILIVPGVWTINILFSYFWLRRFRFGPMEWLWRSLTYWKRQPMKI